MEAAPICCCFGAALAAWRKDWRTRLNWMPNLVLCVDTSARPKAIVINESAQVEVEAQILFGVCVCLSGMTLRNLLAGRSEYEIGTVELL